MNEKQRVESAFRPLFFLRVEFRRFMPIAASIHAAPASAPALGLFCEAQDAIVMLALADAFRGNGSQRLHDNF